MAARIDGIFRTYFEDYAKAFDAFDAERIAGYYHCPCLMVTTEAVASFSTSGQILENMQGLVALHRAQGLARVNATDVQVAMQAENLAVVRVGWKIADQDGTAISSWSNSYHIVNHGEGWKILVSTTHAGVAVDVNERGDES